MKTVIITGVSKGIGHATARKFLAEGWYVIGTSTKNTTDIDSPNFTLITLDYSDSASIAEGVSKIKKLGKKVDVLMNNAAVFLDKIGERIDVEALATTLKINVVGTVSFTEQIVPLMNVNGHVINISSMAASLTDPIEWGWITPAYKMSKVAINMYTRVLAEQLKDEHITVSSIDPGWVRTDMGGEEAPKLPEEAATDIYNLAISNIESGQFWLEGKKRGW